MALSALLFLLSACTGNDPSPGASSEPSTTASPETSATAASEITAATVSGTATETASGIVTEAVTEAASEAVTEAATEPVTGDTSETESSVQAVVCTELVLATLNIKHGAEGLDTVADAIRDISPDIIGLEEVDVNCDRSGNIDEPEELARLAGYPYHAFSKAINLGDGEYGTAILSRYPIEYFEVIALEHGNGEGRSVGHAVINVEGMELHVLVTHLSYEDRSLRITQMSTIASLLNDFDHYALLGDLNSFNIEDISYLGGAYYVNRADRRYTTFPRRDLAIDNIVVSKGFTELTSGISDAECSDHKLLYAVFQFMGE